MISISPPLARKSSRGRKEAFAVSAPLENPRLGRTTAALDTASPRALHSFPADVRPLPRSTSMTLQRAPSFVPSHPYATARPTAPAPESPVVQEFGIAVSAPPTPPDELVGNREPKSRRRRPSTRKQGAASDDERRRPSAALLGPTQLRDSPMPFSKLKTTTSTSTLGPAFGSSPSLASSIATRITHGVGSDPRPPRSGSDKEDVAAGRKPKKKSKKGAAQVEPVLEAPHRLPEVATLLAGGPRFSVGTLLNEYYALSKADELEELHAQRQRGAPVPRSDGTRSATSTDLAVPTLSPSSTALDSPAPPASVVKGFFSRWRKPKPAPTADLNAKAGGTSLASTRPSVESIRSHPNRLRKPRRPAPDSPPRQRANSSATAPVGFRSGLHLRRTSSLPPLPSLLTPQVPPNPLPTARQILADLPIERRARSERTVWKESEGNSTKAARVADWLLHVAPSQGAGPPSPLAEHPPSDSEPVAAFPALSAFASPDPKRRSSIDNLPPRPAFFNSSPASSFPGSPDGTPTVTRRNGATGDRTDNSLDMPRTPTENYADSADAPYPIRHGALKPTQTPTPPQRLHAPPQRSHKPSRGHFTAPPGTLRRRGSLDSLVDPSHPGVGTAELAPAAGSISVSGTHSSPHSLGTSQSSGAFTLSSVADDTLFFSPPTRPRRRAGRRSAYWQPRQGKGSTRSTADSLVDPGISSRNSGGTQLLQA